MNPTKEIAQKVLTTVDAGLCSGVGEPIPGKMCIEAAVCFAYGLPHGDNPPCVGSAVRSFKIKLNDSHWSSDAARAKGMRKIAIAQLGSDSIDQNEFRKLLVVKTCQRIVPVALRAAASVNPTFSDALEAEAKKCEAVSSLGEIQATCINARRVARSACDAYDAYTAYTAYTADAYAAYDAYAAAYDAADAADAAAAAAGADAYADAYAAYTAAASAAKSLIKQLKRDEILTLAADICLEVLVELKSPGCEWLFLCD